MTTRNRFLPDGWYPSSADACRREIQGFEDYVQKNKPAVGSAKGGIIPHAGWYFSGRLAALVFSAAAAHVKPDVVAVFGGHLGPGRGIVYTDNTWETPLGPIDIDLDLTGEAAKRIKLRPEGPATNDNTVEIQMPLVKYYFPDSKLAAFRAPHSGDAAVLGETVAELAGQQGKTLLAFGSTDLTHYGPNYGFSPKGNDSRAVTWVKDVNDRGFIDLALAMDTEGLLEHAAMHHSACSAGGAAAAAAACKKMGGTRGVLADYYTSYDIMRGDSFVGYTGIIYE